MNQMKAIGIVSPFIALLFPLALCHGTEVASGRPLSAIQFNRDIRPILSENCFSCHGPDKNKRKADLRLDIETGGAFAITKATFPSLPARLQRASCLSESHPQILTS